MTRRVRVVRLAMFLLLKKLNFSIRAGTKTEATMMAIARLMMTTTEKSFRSCLRKSGSQNTMTSAPIVVSMAASTPMKALRLR